MVLPLSPFLSHLPHSRGGNPLTSPLPIALAAHRDSPCCMQPLSSLFSLSALIAFLIRITSFCIESEIHPVIFFFSFKENKEVREAMVACKTILFFCCPFSHHILCTTTKSRMPCVYVQLTSTIHHTPTGFSPSSLCSDRLPLRHSGKCIILKYI